MLVFEAGHAFILKQPKSTEYLMSAYGYSVLTICKQVVQPDFSVHFSANPLLSNKSQNYFLSAFFI